MEINYKPEIFLNAKKASGCLKLTAVSREQISIKY